MAADLVADFPLPPATPAAEFEAPASPVPGAHQLEVAVASTGPTLPVQIHLCCVLSGGILVVGGVAPWPCNELDALDLLVGTARVDLLHELVVLSVPTIGATGPGPANPAAPQVMASSGGGAVSRCGFLSAIALATGDPAVVREVALHLSGPRGTAAGTAVLCTDPRDAWQRVVSHLASVEPNSRIALLERIAAIRRSAPHTHGAAPAPGSSKRLLADALADALHVAPASRAPANGHAPTNGRAATNGLANALAANPADTLTAALAQQIALAVNELPEHLDAQAQAAMSAHGAHTLMMSIDRPVVVGRQGIFLTGWFHAEAVDRVQVSCRAPDGELRLDDRWIRLARPDVVAHLATLGVVEPGQPGFCCFVPLPPGRWPQDWPHYLAVSCGTGRRLQTWRLRLPQPAASEPALQAIRTVLGALDLRCDDLRQMLDQHIGPAVGALWRARTPRRREIVECFGPPPAEPRVSVIVPLYGRHDFADYQLALFAHDRDFQSVELIYVVDDRSIVDAFGAACNDLYGVYRVPFTLAYAGDSLGIAAATNHGAARARAPYLLLLNSDVMPKQRGWLSMMLDIHRASAERGVLGAKLLYEDGTVQHAGMSSRRNPQWQGMWINHHPQKGLSPAGLGGIREVEAVTTACALVDTALYRKLGGLSEDYIVGDFGDSDFCHRVRRSGRRNRVALDVTLYHLERQSQLLVGDASFERALTLYNCWLHDQRWGASLAKAEAVARTGAAKASA